MRPPIRVIALDGTGPLLAAALAVLPSAIDGSANAAPKIEAVLQTGGFRFGSVLDLYSPDFLPAAAKYGDLPGALALARGRVPRLLVLGEGESAPTDPIKWLLEKPQ